MGVVTAFAPGHLTGLFQICDQPENPLQKGSRGSGVSLDLGVYTTVTAKPSTTTNWEIKINGAQTEGAFVSENVLRRFSKHFTPHTISVEHHVETPVVAGFGSSGGGALSLSLALNEVTNAGLLETEAAQIAHLAEIECKTGLGSVFAAVSGGFGVLTKPGAPGVGEAILYPDQANLRVVYIYYGPIPTREALSNPALRTRINEIGERFVDELAKKPTVDRFMRFSRQFTEHLNLVTPKLRKVFDIMDNVGITFTMAMFGEVAFGVMQKDKAVESAKLFESFFPGNEAVVVGINEEGAKITSITP